MSEAVRLENVHKSFDHNEVLRGIDLALDEHEVVCLIGASGSGKSTMLRCVNLLEPIDRGRIFVAGSEVTARGVDVNRVRRGIGIVFQAFNLFPHMTVLRNVTLAPREVLGVSKADAEARALELLDRIGLADKRDDYPDRLSGGQQQRVAIARALAMRPQLMLLDEVTSALDPELVAEVLNLIRELAAGGMTMIIATHEMTFARDIANRVCFLDAGTILEEGPPQQIFSAPREPRTQQFLQRIVEAGRLYRAKSGSLRFAMTTLHGLNGWSDATSRDVAPGEASSPSPEPPRRVPDSGGAGIRAIDRAGCGCDSPSHARHGRLVLRRVRPPLLGTRCRRRGGPLLLPFVAVRKGEAIHMPDRNAVRDHFASAMNAYRLASGAGAWTPVEIDTRELGDNSVFATVHWHALDADGEVVRDTWTSYQLLATPGGWRFVSYTNHF